MLLRGLYLKSRLETWLDGWDCGVGFWVKGASLEAVVWYQCVFGFIRGLESVWQSSLDLVAGHNGMGVFLQHRGKRVAMRRIWR